MAKDDYYIVNSWMIDDLGLSGIELEVFAIIWSLSRADKQMYIGGNSHLMRMTRKTEPTIIATLKKLCEKGLIEKMPVTVNKVERNYYKAISQGLNNLSGGTKKILAPNIESNIESNIKDNSVTDVTHSGADEIKASFEYFWKKYGKVGAKQQAVKEWTKMTQKERETCMSRIDEYITFCKLSTRRMKDASSYLHQKCFLEDWNDMIPMSYQTDDGATDVVSRFKRYMVKNYRPLIFHNNPLTYEQYKEKLESYEAEDLNRALLLLCKRDVNQYPSILNGLEMMLKSDEFLNVA